MNNSLVEIKKIPKGEKFIPAPLLQKLYDTIDNARDKAYIMYSAETGLRVSDVLGTHLENMDFQNMRTWTYDFKKDTWRFVYWPEKIKGTLFMWLKKRGNHEGKVFTFTPRTAQRLIKKYCKQIGFVYWENAGPHWLRHTFIRLSRSVGRDIKSVQQNTGNTINTLLEIYAELSPDNMKDEINKKELIK